MLCTLELAVMADTVEGGSQAKLKAAWSQPKWVIHLCSIITMFVFFSLHFRSLLLLYVSVMGMYWVASGG